MFQNQVLFQNEIQKYWVLIKLKWIFFKVYLAFFESTLLRFVAECSMLIDLHFLAAENPFKKSSANLNVCSKAFCHLFQVVLEYQWELRMNSNILS